MGACELRFTSGPEDLQGGVVLRMAHGKKDDVYVYVFSVFSRQPT